MKYKEYTYFANDSAFSIVVYANNKKNADIIANKYADYYAKRFVQYAIKPISFYKCSNSEEVKQNVKDLIEKYGEDLFQAQIDWVNDLIKKLEVNKMIEIKPGMVVEMKTGERYLVGKYNADSQNGASTEKLLAISLSNFKINYHLSSMIFIEADKVRKVYKDIKCNEVLYFAKEIMLDEVEKEYLSAFIKPFKNRVINIMLKESSIYKDVIFMQITLKGKFNNAGREEISLPRFKKGTMYKKLYVNNPYTLKELDLE